MNKLLIYPYNYKNHELTEFSELLKDYQLTVAVVPHNIDHELVNHEHASNDFLLTDNFDEGLKICDSVLFLEGISGNNTLYTEKINSAIQLNKELLAVKSLKCELQNFVGDTVLDNIKIIGGGEDCSTLKKSHQLKRINVPVIAIMGLGEYCGKFSCEITLRQFFVEKGYSVLQLGSKDYSDLFGFESMPYDIFNQDISIANKILQFNQYLYQTSKKANPDVIILGILEGIMQVNHKIFNNFGEMASIIGQAVQIDIGMLGVYYQDELNYQYYEYIKKLRNYCMYKFNCPIDYVFISNTHSEVDENEESKLNYYHYDKVPPVEQSTLSDNNIINFFNMEDKNCINKIFNKIHNELLTNIAVL